MFTSHRPRQVHIPSTKKQIQDDIVVDGLLKKSNRILVSISSHAFPIDLFPNTVIVEEGRVTIVNRKFLSSDVHSVDIRNISNVLIHTTFFFSQLVIISKTFEENEIKIINLRTNEAVYVRRILEGLRTLENKDIQTSTYSIDELLTTLEELSTTEIVL